MIEVVINYRVENTAKGLIVWRVTATGTVERVGGGRRVFPSYQEALDAIAAAHRADQAAATRLGVLVRHTAG